MVFEVDPDKPHIPALARILSGMGLLLLVGCVLSLLLAFSGYAWVNEIYAMAAAGGLFLLGLLFIGQAKILELLAVVSARLKSRFVMEGFAKSAAGETAAPASNAAAWSGPARAPKERVIHVPDDQARQSGFKVR